MAKSESRGRVPGAQHGFDLFEVWKEHENVAMHFNELLMRLRSQALAAVAAIGTVAGFVVNADESMPSDLRWGTLAVTFAGLALLWLALWVLDFTYYNRLLLGAVDSLLQVEKASKSGPELSSISLSTDIERAVRKGPGRGNWSRAKGRWWFYGIVFVVLVAGALLSLTASGWFSLQRPAVGQAVVGPPDEAGLRDWWSTNGPADWAMVLITAFAVWAAFRTLGAIRNQVNANVDAATAAKDNAAAAKQSAETAEKQLRMAFRPYFDLKEVFAQPDNIYDTDGVASITVGYTVYNASSAQARVVGLAVGYKVLQGGHDVEVSATGTSYDTTLAPGRGYRAPIHVELSEEAKQAFIDKKLVVDVMYRITFRDPPRVPFSRMGLWVVGRFVCPARTTYQAPRGSLPVARTWLPSHPAASGRPVRPDVGAFRVAVPSASSGPLLGSAPPPPVGEGPACESGTSLAQPYKTDSRPATFMMGPPSGAPNARGRKIISNATAHP